jgi:hypothetical protein
MQVTDHVRGTDTAITRKSREVIIMGTVCFLLAIS